MKKFEILRKSPNVTQRHEVSKCCWRSSSDRCVNAGWPQTFNLPKNAKLVLLVKHKKARYASNLSLKGKEF